MWFKIWVFLWVVIIFLGFVAHFNTDERMFLKLIVSMFILFFTSGACAVICKTNEKHY